MANAHNFKLALIGTIHVGLLAQFGGGFGNLSHDNR
jgi:hypothetical protein